MEFSMTQDRLDRFGDPKGIDEILPLATLETARSSSTTDVVLMSNPRSPIFRPQIFSNAGLMYSQLFNLVFLFMLIG